jgi:hypothetical protein
VAELDWLAVGFARLLRRARLPVGSTVVFAEALGAVGMTRREAVYWAGRTTLVRRPEDVELYDRGFAAWWEQVHELPLVSPVEREVTLAFDRGDDDEPGDDDGAPSDDPTLSVRYSRAEVLRQRGARCHVPTPADPLTPWRDWSRQLQVALPPVDQPILIGHSAAGFLLPSLAAALNAAALVFVDARVPPPQGITRPVDGPFFDFVKTLPLEGGLLPPWSQWWPDGAIEAHFPDPSARAEFEADLPRLPLTWFDDRAGHRHPGEGLRSSTTSGAVRG